MSPTDDAIEPPLDALDDKPKLAVPTKAAGIQWPDDLTPRQRILKQITDKLLDESDERSL